MQGVTTVRLGYRKISKTTPCKVAAGAVTGALSGYTTHRGWPRVTHSLHAFFKIRQSDPRAHSGRRSVRRQATLCTVERTLHRDSLQQSTRSCYMGILLWTSCRRNSKLATAKRLSASGLAQMGRHLGKRFGLWPTDPIAEAS
jgi:hypothetical protein